MKKWMFFSVLLLATTLTSCIEIIDDLSLNSDGTGTFKYTVNLSSSKVKINSILALDSLDGKPVPSKDEVKRILNDFKLKLALKEGITNVALEEDYTNYIFKMSCDFADVAALQNAIKKSVAEVSKHGKTDLDDYNWISWTGNSLTRAVPQFALSSVRKMKGEDMELLKQGSYTNITRFDKEVLKCENTSAQLSKSKKAVMLKLNAHSLFNDVQLMSNKIQLTE